MSAGDYYNNDRHWPRWPDQPSGPTWRPLLPEEKLTYNMERVDKAEAERDAARSWAQEEHRMGQEKAIETIKAKRRLDVEMERAKKAEMERDAARAEYEWHVAEFARKNIKLRKALEEAGENLMEINAGFQSFQGKEHRVDHDYALARMLCEEALAAALKINEALEP